MGENRIATYCCEQCRAVAFSCHWRWWKVHDGVGNREPVFPRERNEMSTLQHQPPNPVHIPGTSKGEELSVHQGKEPGRGSGKHYRSSRDSTGINPEDRKPIHPDMPELPPA